MAMISKISIQLHMSSEIVNMSKSKKGEGFMNSAINKLPIELHLPMYQYCGPGTDLKKRLARGDPGINKLDAACKEHDIAYDKYQTDDAERTKADEILASRAWDRVISLNAGIGERSNALGVAAAMKAKIGLAKLGGGMSRMTPKTKKKKTKKKSSKKLGGGMSLKTKKVKKMKKSKKKKCCSFKTLVQKTGNYVKSVQPTTQTELINTAIAAAKRIKKSIGKISQPRVIPIPKTGGVLPLVPIFAGLSALGSLMGGGVAVSRAVMSANEAKRTLEESRRHNRHLEAIAIGNSSKQGSGLYLKPYRKGYGIYLKPYPQSKNP